MIYDLIVIGGGPAGMMAAGKAGEQGARVLLLEKNSTLGTKLLITGNGRCNLTNNSFSKKELIDQYGKNGKFLYPSFNEFAVDEVINFFENRGVKTKTEENGKVFPVSNHSNDVLKVLLKYISKSNAQLKTNTAVDKIISKKNKIEKIITTTGEEFMANNYLICTGGKSYPLTGSTGDGYIWLKNLGHKIVEPQPGLCPIILNEKSVKNLEGLSLQNITIDLFQNNNKFKSATGDIIFTSKGISGPLALNISNDIGKRLTDKIILKINLFSILNIEKIDSVENNTNISPQELDKIILEQFKILCNKNIKNALEILLPKKLVPIFINFSNLNPEKKVNLISKDERKKLIDLILNFEFSVKRLAGFERAVITRGGVDLKEVDPKTLKSKIIDNLYFAGEILDLDGPTGGFNLQICWSTGYLAGISTTQKIH